MSNDDQRDFEEERYNARLMVDPGEQHPPSDELAVRCGDVTAEVGHGADCVSLVLVGPGRAAAVNMPPAAARSLARILLAQADAVDPVGRVADIRNALAGASPDWVTWVHSGGGTLVTVDTPGPAPEGVVIAGQPAKWVRADGAS